MAPLRGMAKSKYEEDCERRCLESVVEQCEKSSFECECTREDLRWFDEHCEQSNFEREYEGRLADSGVWGFAAAMRSCVSGTARVECRSSTYLPLVNGHRIRR